MKNPINALRAIVAQVKALGGAGRGGGTRKLAEARAAASGKTVAAEMRQIQRAIKADRDPPKQSPQVARAGAAAAMAATIRNARSIGVGPVRVLYDQRDEGTRDLKTRTVGGELAAELARIANDLERGTIDAAEAQREVGQALLDDYGAGRSLDIDQDGLDGLDYR